MDNCPRCNVLKAKLKERAVPFEEFNVGTDDGMIEALMDNVNIHSPMPVVHVSDEEIYVLDDVRKIHEFLDKFAPQPKKN
jgi:glutaredoxin